MNILQQTIAAAGTVVSGSVRLLTAPRNLTIQGKFAYGSGGTSVDAYVQTSLDNGSTWVDIAEFSWTTSAGTKIYNLSGGTAKTTAVTPTDGTLTANTAVDGVLGPQFRVKVVSVGTYAGATSVAIDIASDQIA